MPFLLTIFIGNEILTVQFSCYSPTRIHIGFKTDTAANLKKPQEFTMQVLVNHYPKYSQKIVTGITICLLFITLVTLSACATTYDKMDKLNSTLRAYEKALRWAKFDMAYSYHKWDTDEQPSLPKYLKDIRLTSYSTSNKSFDEKTMTAKQKVTMRYYNQNNLRERSLEDKQRWQYFPDEKRWYLMSKPPTFQ